MIFVPEENAMPPSHVNWGWFLKNEFRCSSTFFMYILPKRVSLGRAWQVLEKRCFKNRPYGTILKFVFGMYTGIIIMLPPGRLGWCPVCPNGRSNCTSKNFTLDRGMFINTMYVHKAGANPTTSEFTTTTPVCHATERSEAVAWARRCRLSQLTGWWTRKE
jgi:hypothetical protein